MSSPSHHMFSSRAHTLISEQENRNLPAYDFAKKCQSPWNLTDDKNIWIVSFGDVILNIDIWHYHVNVVDQISQNFIRITQNGVFHIYNPVRE